MFRGRNSRIDAPVRPKLCTERALLHGRLTPQAGAGNDEGGRIHKGLWLPEGRARQWLQAEFNCLSFIVFSPRCILPKLAILAGCAYLVGPWDIIPSSTPIFGHFDELGILLAGLIAARLLVQDEPGPHWLGFRAWHSTGASSRGADASLPRLLARLRADMISAWLIADRRARRLRHGAPNSVAKLHAHTRQAVASDDLRSLAFNLLGYRLWWCLRAPFARSRSDVCNLVVIGGSPRSGTTLLRSILGRHGMVFSGPETTVFLHRISSPAELGDRLGIPAPVIKEFQIASRSQMEFIERCASAVLKRAGKPVWAEKTPHNVLRFGFIRRRFPHARLVHVVRDGRDVVCSLRRQPFSKVEHAAPDSAAAARYCALQWRRSVRAGRRFRNDPAYHEVRYEDLVRDPEPVLRALLNFLGIAWDDRLLAPGPPDGKPDPFEPRASEEIFAGSIERWRQDLSDQDRDSIRPLIGPLLTELGYCEL